MDEPCSALDPTSTRRIEETIAELAPEVTIVIVTHNMQQAARVSQQCAFFLAEQGTPGAIVEAGAHRADLRQPARPAHRRLRQRPVRVTPVELDGSSSSRRRRRPESTTGRATSTRACRRRTGSSAAIARAIGVFVLVAHRLDRAVPGLPGDPDAAPLRPALLHRDPVAARAGHRRHRGRRWSARSRSRSSRWSSAFPLALLTALYISEYAPARSAVDPGRRWST